MGPSSLPVLKLTPLWGVKMQNIKPTIGFNNWAWGKCLRFEKVTGIELSLSHDCFIGRGSVQDTTHTHTLTHMLVHCSPAHDTLSLIASKKSSPDAASHF